MEKHIEKEYKLLVNKEQFETLLANYPNLTFTLQINYYYDNQQLEIMNQHGAMRIREKEQQFIFTLKKVIHDDLFEYECVVPKNDASIFNLPEIKQVLDDFNIIGPFCQINQLETKRAVFATPLYELCFDINTYGDIIDYEIEYEYRKNHDGLSNFQSILNKANLIYTKNSTSKIHRAYEHQASKGNPL